MEVTPHEEPAAPEPEVVPEVIPEEPKSTTPDLRRKQILVVHREPEALDFIAGLLRECGARVTPAKSAAEAILALLQHHDLIITEVGVPVAEGVTLAQQLRQANGGLPAIVLRKQVDAGELTAEVVQALTR
jgi:CheY-like chemotaxis protein